MHKLIDLDRYPIDRPDSEDYAALVARCRQDLANGGMFNLDGFVRADAVEKAVAEVSPPLETAAFAHQREHNVYFRDHVDGVPADHPAMNKVRSANHTIGADQIDGSVMIQIYEYPPLCRFIADTMNKDVLYVMDDPLGRVNVMATRDGEGLNWHFDQSEFTTTIMLQASNEGGELEYVPELRSADNKNLDAVARLLQGEDVGNQIATLTPGTLNVFRGENTPHRVTTVHGSRDRIMTIYSFYENPGVTFTDEMRIGFYGRAAAL